MRFRRDVAGDLGDPAERQLPVVPEPWKVPAIIMVALVCIGILVIAIVAGLRHS